MHSLLMASSSRILGSISGAEGAFAFNALDPTYTSNVIRVRRSSDNAEQDIGLVSGTFDSASYDTFVGANTGYVVTWYDQSGTGNNATQATAAAQMVVGETSGTYHATPDLSDDTYGVAFAGAVNGTLIDARVAGTLEAEIDIGAMYGDWDFNVNLNYGASSPITAVVVYSSVLSEVDRIANRRYIVKATGAGTDFAGTTNMDSWFRNRTDLKKIHCEHFDTSSVTTIKHFARNCSNITTLDVSGWNIASVTKATFFINTCTNLSTLDLSNWDTSSVDTFYRFAVGCSTITTVDISNWDTSSVTTFEDFFKNCTNLTTVTTEGGTGNPFTDSAATNYINAFLGTGLSETVIDDILVRVDAAATSSGTFTQSTGTAPSATGEAEIDTLRGRSWTVTVTGGY